MKGGSIGHQWNRKAPHGRGERGGGEVSRGGGRPGTGGPY